MTGDRRARRTDRGAAAVEFALVAPLLLLLLFGIISYGYMLSFRQSISQAAAEGARAAAVAPAVADREAIASAAIADVLGTACGTAPLTCDFSEDVDACTSACLAVTVTWDYKSDDSKPELLYGFALPDELRYTSTSTISEAP